MPRTAPSTARRVHLSGAFAALGVLTLALTGCGTATDGSPVGNAPAAPVHSAKSSAKSHAHPTAPPTAKQLKAITLQAGDLPAAWVPSASQDDQGGAGDDATMIACTGGRDTSGHVIAQANSPDYTSGGTTVSSDAESYRSKADIDADAALVRNPKLTGCFRDLLRRGLATTLPTGTVVDSLVVDVTAGSAGGPKNVIGTLKCVVKLHLGDRHLVLYEDSELITGRLTEATVHFESVGSPVPAAVQKQVTKLVADRAAKA